MTPTPRKFNGFIKFLPFLIPLVIAGAVFAFGYGVLNSDVKHNTEAIKDNTDMIVVMSKGIIELQRSQAVDSVKYDVIKEDLEEIKRLIKSK